jgi:hypothetical protein
MHLALFLHSPTQDRYIVLVADGTVQQAAGPLTTAQLQEIQRDEWAIPWTPEARALGQWVEARRGEFVQVWPQP